MTQNNLKDNLTVVIAALSDHTAFADCLDAIRNWPVRIVVVSKKSAVVEKMVRGEGCEWIQQDSPCSLFLWNKGLECSTTSWNLLIRSNEVVSGHLKKNIEKQILGPCSTSVLYLPRLKIIFLKKVLKHPLSWSGEPPSGLLYNTGLNPNLISIKKESLEGELICLRDASVSIACSTALDRAKSWCIRICRESPSMNRFQLIIKTFKTAVFALFGNVLSRQALREGFEGLIFCALDFYAYLFGGVLYYEEMIRGGGQIADQIQRVKKILIIKAMGIGDVVMATPVFRNIKTLLPHASLSVLVAAPVDSILKGNPHIDKLHSLPRGLTSKNIKTMIGSLIDEMNREKFDLIINLQAKNLSSLILKKVHARWKIDRSYYYRDKITDVLVGCETLKRSGIERDLDCLRRIGLEPKDKFPEVFLKSKDIDKAGIFFSSNGLDLNKKTVFIHPVASVEMRGWGVNNFSQLCRILAVDHKFQIIANVFESEIKLIDPIIEAVPEVVVYSGSVRGMLGVIKKCDLLIGNDSGPSHLSVAMDVPTIILNGPSSVSLYRDPDVYTDKHFVFNKEVPCRDLFQTQCYSYIDPESNTPVCQDQICLDFSVDEVVAKAIELTQ